MRTSAVGRFDSGTADWVRNMPRERIYRAVSGGQRSAANTEVMREPSDFQSLSMVPPRNHEHATPILVLVSFRSSEEGLENSPEIRTWLSRPNLWQHPEPDSSLWRGVYAPRRRRPILFSQEVEFQMADLPRRKRHIAITPRMLASEENDAGREED